MTFRPLSNAVPNRASTVFSGVSPNPISAAPKPSTLTRISVAPKARVSSVPLAVQNVILSRSDLGRADNWIAARNLIAAPVDGDPQPIFQADAWFPAQHLARAGGIATHAPDLVWPVGQRPDLHLGTGLGQIDNLTHQIANWNLFAAGNIHGSVHLLRVLRRQNHAIGQIRYKIELACLVSGSGSDWFTPQSFENQLRNNRLGALIGAKCVERPQQDDRWATPDLL